MTARPRVRKPALPGVHGAPFGHHANDHTNDQRERPARRTSAKDQGASSMYRTAPGVGFLLPLVALLVVGGVVAAVVAGVRAWRRRRD
ncbi:hypothetical protein GCM10010211_84710 [Streptomyces albospinus]|uniref:Uncharacterized protein n=1 Tax=Streptomyces albospinus TaxID=285515 RepID=A0ABQ2VP80_9ACTN|nr:hypothetical protein [Streptomyces albospinus]GGV04637.1 hypothetical protein GCM10010211_84710 [Streptomyces albospinus]